MSSSKETESALSQVPLFVRKPLEGREEGEVRGFQVERCFGAHGCPNRVVRHEDLVQRLEGVLERWDLKDFLEEKMRGPLKMHHVFRVSVADCPNACSRPQIADVGLIGALRPKIGDGVCTQCGACVETCRERAIVLEEGTGIPSIDPQKCLSCGQCIRVCPSAVLVNGKEGYRILIGGKLGRHPQLGRELGKIFSLAASLQVVEHCIAHYLQHNETGERFGQVLLRFPPDNGELTRLE